MDDSVEALFDQLCEMIKELNPSIYEEPKKWYINFVCNKKVILSVVPNQSSISVVLNADKDQLEPKDNLEDISSKGHIGVGNCKMKVTTDDDIWVILGYIEQIIGSKQMSSSGTL